AARGWQTRCELERRLVSADNMGAGWHSFHSEGRDTAMQRIFISLGVLLWIAAIEAGGQDPQRRDHSGSPSAGSRSPSNNNNGMTLRFDFFPGRYFPGPVFCFYPQPFFTRVPTPYPYPPLVPPSLSYPPARRPPPAPPQNNQPPAANPPAANNQPQKPAPP